MRAVVLHFVTVRISQDPTSETKISHDQGHIYIPLWIHLTYIDILIAHTINQLIPPIYWFSSTHKSSSLHVLLSSNLDSHNNGVVVFFFSSRGTSFARL